MSRGQSARRWALAMTARPSVTGTPDEASFGPWLAAELTRAFPQAEVWTWPVAAGDGRHCVAMLLRGRGARTLVLTGHFDTVTVADYGDLAPLATEPDLLGPALLARLGAKAGTAAEKRALADLERGDFIPGRGLLDMKAGLAAGLAVCEGFAAGDSGNLLFLAVPDEEANSVGARAAAPVLAGMARARGLDLVGAVNLDAIADDGDGTAGQAIALGTIGKLLPFSFIVGRSTHAGFPLAGVNAAVLAAAIAGEVEWAVELTDPAAGGTPPSLLMLRDGKAGYDVTTPGTAFAAFNVLTVAKGPDVVLAAFDALCAAAGARALSALAARAPGAGLPATLPVVRFSELDAQVKADDPKAHAAARTDLPEASLSDLCRIITARLWQASGRAGPAVVTGFGSMPYLPTELSDRPEAQRLHAAARRAAEVTARKHQTPIRLDAVFAGISDMSFLGEANAAAMAVIGAETPVWGGAIAWPEEGGIAGLPIVNAGPWGRDYHTPLERMHVRYGFEVLPDLIAALAREMLEPEVAP